MPAPERVLFLSGELTFRGSSILAMRLAQGLQERGMEAVMLCTHVGHIDHRLIASVPLHVLPGFAKAFWGRIVRRSVLKNLIEHPPDVIHLLTPELLPQAVWLGNRLSRPVVLSVNNHSEASSLTLPPSSACCRVLVTFSESVQAALPAIDELNNIEQRVILPGIPVSESETASPVLESGRAPVIGMAGPLEVLKGGSFFLRACHRVISDGNDIRLVIAGSGPEERNLRKLATSLQLDDQVTFVDDSTDMQTFLSAMDVFCLPSLQQGIGVLLLEAMALGRPVIASGVGGIISVLDNNSAGLTVPASDSRQLAVAIQELISNPVQAKKIARAGRELVASRFSQQRMLDEMTNLYAELCGTGPATVQMPAPTETSTQEQP